MGIQDDDYVRLNLISDFIEDFVLPSSRQRLYYLLSKPKRRHEIINAFHHHGTFDPKYLLPIPPQEQNATGIYKRMKNLGAPARCFALSIMLSPNGEVDLKHALEECVGQSSETILYCRDAKVGYWEGDWGSRWILCRAKAQASR